MSENQSCVHNVSSPGGGRKTHANRRAERAAVETKP
jgi:hypothetical protein